MAKRLFDLLLSSLGLLLLGPLLLLIALLIKLDSKGPVFFRQERIGLHGKPFKIRKFRTMITQAEKHGLQLTVGPDQRITRIGHWLRRNKLDELPQLIDVLVGSMSLVGPRPEVPRYVDHYPRDLFDIIFSVRPGITDLASIEYRNENNLLAESDDPEKTYIETVMPAKLNYYRQYVEQQSLLLDTQIILRTIGEIFR